MLFGGERYFASDATLQRLKESLESQKRRVEALRHSKKEKEEELQMNKAVQIVKKQSTINVLREKMAEKARELSTAKRLNKKLTKEVTKTEAKKNRRSNLSAWTMHVKKAKGEKSIKELSASFKALTPEAKAELVAQTVAYNNSAPAPSSAPKVKVPRKPTNYMKFFAEYTKKHHKQGTRITETAKACGAAWKALSPAEKEQWKQV